MGERRIDPKADIIKYELFYNKLDAILNEAKEVVRYLSGSVITRESGEVQEAFYLPNGEAAHLACGILMHIMNVTRVIKYMNENRYDAEDIGIYDGDQFINNDAYIGGMHVPDTGIIAPIYYKDTLLGYVAAISHTIEVGAIEPGGMCPRATEAYHDGLHLPAVKLVERGRMQRDLFNMILRSVRDPRGIELDIRARLAGNERTRKRILELVDEVGLEYFSAACKQLVEDAAESARAKIRSLKPGLYRVRVYDDSFGETEKLAIIQLEVRVTRDGELWIDIPVVSPQGKCFDNAYLPAVEATAFYTLLDLLFYDIRWNTGLAKVVRIGDILEGSRLNAHPDASVGYATVGIAAVFCNALMEALGRAAFVSGNKKDVMGGATTMNDTPVGGISQFGTVCGNFLTSSAMAAGGGARIDCDGIDSSVDMYNPWTYVADTEGEEMLLPVLHIAKTHRANSGGFGRFRGGTGVEHVTMVHGSDLLSVLHFGSGGKVPVNQGLFGGYPGASSYFDWFLDTDICERLKEGDPIPFEVTKLTEYLKGEFLPGQPNAPSRVLKSGDMWVSTSCGGGAGLGDPLERDPETIARDIENKVVTLDIAERAYCVAIHPETLRVDYEETQRRRKKSISERLKNGIPGKKFLGALVEKRQKGDLPKVALDFINETASFCPAFQKELDEEERIASTKDLSPIGKVAINSVLCELTPHINVVEDEQGRKILVCSKCGFGYCETKENFKLYSLINERAPEEIYSGRLAFDKDWCIFREFYCPGCGVQTEVEATPPGTPILHLYELEEL
jgi:acetophenone carboxylase